MTKDGICEKCGSPLPFAREVDMDGKLSSWYACEECEPESLPMTHSDTASAKKKRLKGQYDNGLPCSCPDVGWSTTCSASRHVRRPQDPETWLDKNGDKIVHGDMLKYVNPNRPNRVQPIHEALIQDGDCWVKPEGERPHRARRRSSWQSKRWEIITSQGLPKVL